VKLQAKLNSGLSPNLCASKCPAFRNWGNS